MINFFICIFVLSKFSFYNGLSQANPAVVKLPLGEIQGKVHGKYISFESIPYAEAPIGSLRFESPKPFTKHWDGIRNASNQSHQQCIQLVAGNGGNSVEGSEDCLYLNIFTPSLELGKQFPVMIHIHGGSYKSFSGNWLGEELIMQYENMIVVTFNYRLGALGFLSTGDNEISGNMGLKDQRLAIKWVKENIQHFNGNPDNILLTGFSAGASSVHFHLLSKSTENLVKAAISFSATALCPWALDKSPKEKAVKVAEFYNCETKNTKLMKDCLKKVKAENFVRAEELFSVYLHFPLIIFAPVIESASSEDGFLTDSPQNIMRKGLGAQIPYMISYTLDEGAAFVANLLNKNPATGKLLLNELEDRFDELAPIMLSYNTSSEAEKARRTSMLRTKYDLKFNEVAVQSFWSIEDMFSDQFVINGALETARIYNKYNKMPIYIYIFDNAPPYNLANLLSGQNDIKFGSTHGDDVFLMLSSPIRKNHPFTKVEQKLSQNLIQMLVSFAKNGKPTYQGRDFPESKSKKGFLNVLMISEKPTKIEGVIVTGE